MLSISLCLSSFEKLIISAYLFRLFLLTLTKNNSLLFPPLLREVLVISISNLVKIDAKLSINLAEIQAHTAFPGFRKPSVSINPRANPLKEDKQYLIL